MSAERVFAIVPARRGSKRYPRKNVAPLAGRPLVQWTIDAALASNIFDTIVVSSDDDDVLEIAENAQVIALRRPPVLAGDEVPVMDVCRHAVRERNATDFHAAYILLPTTPFRSAPTIRNAWRTFMEQDGDVLLSLSKADYPPQWTLAWEDGIVRPLDVLGYEKPRQRLTPAYRHDGAHLIVRIPHLLGGRPLLAGRTVGFQSSLPESVDIDEPVDLSWAEFLLSSGAVEVPA